MKVLHVVMHGLSSIIDSNQVRKAIRTGMPGSVNKNGPFQM